MKLPRCPHPRCKRELPAEFIVSAHNSLIAQRKLPGSLGQVRNPKGRPRKEKEETK